MKCADDCGLVKRFSLDRAVVRYSVFWQGTGSGLSYDTLSEILMLQAEAGMGNVYTYARGQSNCSNNSHDDRIV